MLLQTLGDFKSPTGEHVLTSGHHFYKRRFWHQVQPILSEENMGFKAELKNSGCLFTGAFPQHTSPLNLLAGSELRQHSQFQFYLLTQSAKQPLRIRAAAFHRRQVSFASWLKISKVFALSVNRKQELIWIIPEMFLSQLTNVHSLSFNPPLPNNFLSKSIHLIKSDCLVLP